VSFKHLKLSLACFFSLRHQYLKLITITIICLHSQTHLEKNGFPIYSPKISYWIATVTSAWNQLESWVTVQTKLFCKGTLRIHSFTETFTKKDQQPILMSYFEEILMFSFIYWTWFISQRKQKVFFFDSAKESRWWVRGSGS